MCGLMCGIIYGASGGVTATKWPLIKFCARPVNRSITPRQETTAVAISGDQIVLGYVLVGSPLSLDSARFTGLNPGQCLSLRRRGRIVGGLEVLVALEVVAVFQSVQNPRHVLGRLDVMREAGEVTG